MKGACKGRPYVTCARYGSCQTSTNCNSLLYDGNNGHVDFLIRDVLCFPRQLMRFVVQFRRRTLPLLSPSDDGNTPRHVSCEAPEIQRFPDKSPFPAQLWDLEKTFWPLVAYRVVDYEPAAMRIISNER